MPILDLVVSTNMPFKRLSTRRTCSLLQSGKIAKNSSPPYLAATSDPRVAHFNGLPCRWHRAISSSSRCIMYRRLNRFRSHHFFLQPKVESRLLPNFCATGIYVEGTCLRYPWLL